VRIALTLASLAIPAMLAGCTARSGAQPPSPALATTNDACGASKLGAFIGVKPATEVLAKIKALAGTQIVRVVGPDDAMTMDVRTDRLTITTGADGRITQLRCV